MNVSVSVPAIISIAVWSRAPGGRPRINRIKRGSGGECTVTSESEEIVAAGRRGVQDVAGSNRTSALPGGRGLARSQTAATCVTRHGMGGLSQRCQHPTLRRENRNEKTPQKTHSTRTQEIDGDIRDPAKWSGRRPLCWAPAAHTRDKGVVLDMRWC